uniref:Uncharacterized protein n=1 Tax=Lotharella oceanica TaxID=641309 RepID=A0A7S2TU54_9EUKA
MKAKDEQALDICLAENEGDYKLAFRPLMLAATINTWAVEQLLTPEELNQQSSGTLSDALSIAHHMNSVNVDVFEQKDGGIHDEHKFTPLMMAILFGPQVIILRFH